MKAIITISVDIDDSKEPENAEKILHENLDGLVDKNKVAAALQGDSKLNVVAVQAWIQVDKNA